MKMRMTICLLGALLGAALVMPARAQDPKPARGQGQEQGGEKKREQGGEQKKGEGEKREAPKGEDNDEARIAYQMPLYPLDVCVISGEKLGPDAKSFLVDGRLVRTCCPRCEAKIKADPKEALKKLDEATIRAQKASYPMERCAVSGDKLGEGAIDVVHNSRLVRFCSETCAAEFKKDPESTLRKLDSAYIASQKKHYPLDTCVVMGGDPIGEDGIDFLYGNRLVRFCCKKCIKTFRADPAKYLAKLDEAAAKQKKN